MQHEMLIPHWNAGGWMALQSTSSLGRSQKQKAHNIDMHTEALIVAVAPHYRRISNTEGSSAASKCR